MDWRLSRLGFAWIRLGSSARHLDFSFFTSLPPRALDLILSSVLALTQIADNRATIVPAARAMPMRVLVAASGAGAGDGPGVGEGAGEGDTLVESWARTAPSG